MKFPNCKEYQNIIANSDSPRDAKILGRQKPAKYSSQIVANQIQKYKGIAIFRDDWKDIKMKIMFTALKAKFSQNEDLKLKLQETKGIFLQENTRQKDWKASLGLLLMYIRDDGIKWQENYSKYISKDNYFKFYQLNDIE